MGGRVGGGEGGCKSCNYYTVKTKTGGSFSALDTKKKNLTILVAELVYIMLNLCLSRQFKCNV